MGRAAHIVLTSIVYKNTIGNNFPLIVNFKMSRLICVWVAFFTVLTINGSEAVYRNIEKRILEAFDETFPMENSNLIEGDIIPDDDDDDDDDNDGDEMLMMYNAIVSDSKRWRKGIVPYVVDGNLKSIEPLIRDAMDHIEEKIKCVRFVPRGNEKDHILISNRNGCHSYVGRQGGQQVVSLGKGCHHFGVVVHELTHALGFYHEHNRSDRDEYIRVYMDNIDPRYGKQFRKKQATDNRLLNSFSYDSIMLYGSKSFSKTKDKPSMTKLNGGTLTEVHQKKGLSNSDVERATIKMAALAVDPAKSWRRSEDQSFARRRAEIKSTIRLQYVTRVVYVSKGFMGNVCCLRGGGGPKRNRPTPARATSAESVDHSPTAAHTILEQPVDDRQCGRLCTQKSTNSESRANRNSALEANVVDLFNRYKAADEDIIDAEGIYQLCEDLELEADDFRILVLAWYCHASQMCQFTREEFISGLLALTADSIASLKRTLQEASSQLKHLGSSQYHSLYKWAFSFALESDTQRTLSVEIASQLWKVVFSPDEPPILEFWLRFLESSADSVRGISRDSWNLFLIFVRRCAHDLSTYDETEAWPSLFDDFVHFHNDQTNQNCSKTLWNNPANGNVISSP